MNWLRIRWWISVVLFATSTVGFALTFPLWLCGWISDRAMLGLTLALIWGALQYEAFNSLQLAHTGKQIEES